MPRLFSYARFIALAAGVCLLFMAAPGHAQSAPASTLIEVCPAVGIQQGTPDYQPGGIILTTFDRTALWVYEIGTERRYPLPDTVPCSTNCHLSRDAQWITYFNDETNAYNKMRLDGTERSLLAENAGDVEWWGDGMLLIWTPAHDAYLRAETGTHREYLQVDGVISVQPGGRWGLVVEPEGDGFARALVNLELRGLQNVYEQRLGLGIDLPYFDSSAWAPNGYSLAYVAPVAFDAEVGTVGGELFGVQPGDGASTQWTDFNSIYGAVRINGLSVGTLSWSPDSTRIAFWVTELTGPDPVGNTGSAVIHIYNTLTGELQKFCGFSTTEHTPNPPRLLWSPGGTHLAFGANIPGDERGYLLMALDTTTGIFTALSDGIYPALGAPDVIAWGLPPQ